MPQDSDFVHLHVHSDYSLVDGAAKVEALAQAAKRSGQKALALTDHGTLSGLVAFYKACKKEAIKPLLGCEAYLAWGDDPGAHKRREERKSEDRGGAGGRDYNHLTIIAKNEAGWRNLTRLATEASLEGFYYRPRMSWDLLRRHHEGLIVMSGCLKGEVATPLKLGRYEEARRIAARWKDLLGDDYYLEVQPNSLEEQAVVNDASLRLSKELGIRLVAACDLHYVDPSDAEIQEVKICIQSGKKLSDNAHLKMAPEFYFRTTDDVFRRFSHCTDAIMATREIAEKVEDFDILPGTKGKYFLPKFETPDGSPGPVYFRRLCEEGLRRRYGPDAEKHRERLDYEIGVIERMGFIDYFLILQDVINNSGCPVGPGRGSAAGAIVAYCLGITDIEPIRYGLLFERFLNPDRVSMPDIDVDFCLAGDTEIIDPETGELSTLREFHASGRPVSVSALGDDLKIRKRTSSGVAFRGKKPVYEVFLKSGRSVVGTLDHKFRSLSGWIRLGDLKTGDSLATARALPSGASRRWAKHELVFLAGMLTEGWTRGLSTLMFTNKKCPAYTDEFEAAAAAFEGTFTKRHVSASGVCRVSINSGSSWRNLKSKSGAARLRCGAFSWLESLGVIGAESCDKAIPKSVFLLEDADLEFFLGRLWSGDGALFNGKNTTPSFTTTSRRFAVQVQMLLLRLGITSTILSDPYEKPDGTPRFAHRVYLSGREALLTFARRVAPHIMDDPERIKRFEAFVVKRSMADGNSVSDYVPSSAWLSVPACLAARGLSLKALAASAGVSIAQLGMNTGRRRGFSRGVIRAIGVALGDERLAHLGASDVYWDEVVRIEPKGEQDTYDIVDVSHDHNFALANGIFAHNCEEQRWKAIAYVRKKYGDDRVCQIATFGELKAKSAIKDVGRVLDVSFKETNLLSDLVPKGPDVTLDVAFKASPELAKLRDDERFRRLFDVATRIEGLYRNAGRHAAGIVIGDVPLVERIPLMKVRKDDEGKDTGEEAITTQFVMQEVEDVGLVKMDFLGLRTVTLIEDALRMVEKSTGKRFRKGDIPLRDSANMAETSGANRCPIHARAFADCRCCDKALEVYRRGFVGGVFQVESEGMRKLLMDMKVDRFEDIIAGVALYRPGPMGTGMHEQYVRRKNGEEAVEFDHPSLEGVLSETYGLTCYQEQLMNLSRVLAGFTAGKADELRKATAKKKQDAMAKLKGPFLDGCVNVSGLHRSKAQEIWDKIVFFSEYSFNKSHSAAYALISWQTAWLKANYPVEFMAALLNSWISVTEKLQVYVDDCRRIGVPIDPPDVNVSSAKFDVVKDGGIRRVSFGLAAIRGVGLEAAQHVVDARRAAGGRFRSFLHFCERVDHKVVKSSAIEKWTKAGAFRSLGNRGQILPAIERTMKAATSARKDAAKGQSLLFGGAGGETIEERRLDDALLEAGIPEPPIDVVLSHEKEAFGFHLTASPLDGWRESIDLFASAYCGRLDECKDTVVTICGVVTAVRFLLDKKGQQMAFLNVEDFTGSAECVVFGSMFDKVRQHVRQDAKVIVSGRLQLHREPPSVVVNDMQALTRSHQVVANDEARRKAGVEEARRPDDVRRVEEAKGRVGRPVRALKVEFVVEDTESGHIGAFKHLLHSWRPGPDRVLYSFVRRADGSRAGPFQVGGLVEGLGVEVDEDLRAEIGLVVPSTTMLRVETLA